jgi:hypothetical protein
MVHTGTLTVLFGGFTGNKVLGDTWGWEGELWSQRQDMGPSPRYLHGLAYDRHRERSVLFGGVNDKGENLGDTWELAILA